MEMADHSLNFANENDQADKVVFEAIVDRKHIL